MFSSFYEYIGPLISLSDSEKKTIEQAFTFRLVPANFVLAEEREIAKELFFINKGLIRLYYTRNGQEITGNLFTEQSLAASYDSFLKQLPSVQTLETIEDCELLVISYKTLQGLYKTFPKLYMLARKLAEQRYVNAQLMLSSFILDKPEERYRKFKTQNEDLLLRVPLPMIASYLGITPAAMARMRKRIEE